MSENKNTNILEIKDITKSFKVGSQLVPVLKGVNIDIKNGDFLVIYGPSGSGKSTLLHALLGLEAPTTGTVKYINLDLYGMTEDDRADLRKKSVGIIYQQSYWVKTLTVIENVELPMLINGFDPAISRKKALELLQRVGLLEWAEYAPAELSSGQQQKISLARALGSSPMLIVADEPTGNLDSESGENLMQQLQDLNQKENKTVIMVTHDLQYIKYATKVAHIVDGKIESIDHKGSSTWTTNTHLKSKK